MSECAGNSSERKTRPFSHSLSWSGNGRKCSSFMIKGVNTTVPPFWQEPTTSRCRPRLGQPARLMWIKVEEASPAVKTISDGEPGITARFHRSAANPLGRASMVPDKTLQHDVLAKLGFEPSVNAAHIGVAAKDGVIALTGRVGSFEQKLAAERAARQARGVKAVAQEIEVRLPSDKKCADDEIAESAVKILSWDPTLPPNRIYVRVDHGLVMLRGSVEMPFQVEEAERQVRKLSGVVGVINQIRVRPRQVPIDSAQRIEAGVARR